jgi:hypothetical protein
LNFGSYKNRGRFSSERARPQPQSPSPDTPEVGALISQISFSGREIICDQSSWIVVFGSQARLDSSTICADTRRVCFVPRQSLRIGYPAALLHHQAWRESHINCVSSRGSSLLAFLAPNLIKAALMAVSRMAWASPVSLTSLPNGRSSARCSAFHPTDAAFKPSLYQS